MARVTLVRPAYSAQIYGAVYENDKETRREIRPPLGLMSLAGYLEPAGHEVRIVDGEPELLSAEETARRALATKPQFLGITLTTPEYPFAHEIITRIRHADPSIVTVFGGRTSRTFPSTRSRISETSSTGA